MLLNIQSGRFTGTSKAKKARSHQVVSIDILPASGGGVGLSLIFPGQRHVSIELSAQDARDLASCIRFMASASMRKFKGVTNERL